jgi:hypothetical protein
MDEPTRQTTYFNYFTEIEEHFQQRRGSGLLLSTLDWALIETWKDAGIPLEAALRGIDTAFDRYEQRPSKTRKVNGLAYCTQEVLAAAEEMKEAAVGAAAGSEGGANPGSGPAAARGFDPKEIAVFFRKNADALETAKLPQGGVPARQVAMHAAKALRELAEDFEQKAAGATGAKNPPRLEDLERRLTVMEEKLFGALLATTPDEDIVKVRAEADRDLAPYRRKMPVAQINQLHKQYIHKRLLEKYGLPRLSLFYM